ncbi:MAG TPA: phage major capsid protein [Gammaproteobacteria bacterium]
MLSIQDKRERRNTIAADLRKLLDTHSGKKWTEEHQKRYDDGIAEIEALDQEIAREQRLLDTQADRHFAANPSTPDGTAPSTHGETWINTETGEPIRLLSHGERWQPRTSGASFGRWMRGLLTGKRADDWAEFHNDLATSPDSAGGYTVPEELAREFIDRLRERMVLSQAGARMVPMTTKTLQIAKITGDPTVSWHAENASIADSDPTFDAVTLTSKTIVGLTKLSLELAQDSVNVEEAITRALTQSMAVAIDQAGLIGDGSGNNPMGVANFAGRNTVTAIGAPTNYDFFVDGISALLQDNVPLDGIGASIIHPRLWADLAKLKTGLTSDNTPLVKPAALTQPMLVTTSVPVATGTPDTTTAFQAMWSDLLYGVRQDIRVIPLRERFLGDNLQVAILVYARVDFQPAREDSFVTMEGIALS